MGPTTKAITVTGGVTFPELIDELLSQAKGLVEGGADILLLETCRTRATSKPALLAIERLRREIGGKIPTMVSGTIEPMGTMLAGQTAEAFCASVSHADLLSVGLNCATGPEFMTDHIRTSRAWPRRAFPAIPMPGCPNEEGKYLETPDYAGRAARAIRRSRLDQYRRRLLRHNAPRTSAPSRRWSRARSRAAPRRPAHRTYYSGIDLVEAEESNRPLIVGERTNVIGSRLFKKMIAEEKWEEATEIARWQVKNGAHVIDVCLQIERSRRDCRTFRRSTKS